ncbi:Spy/CpxP family protein refolding chaperone [Hydrogenophaga sp. MI9]|uniref:Spy/CpxP family protein refolding chaperone n=1 Tax=Hydrogenophaga sp. MI9 TaxID=3453719 RepID=UPI003EEBC841
MKPIVKRSLIVAAILAGIAGVSATAIAQGAGPQASANGPRAEEMQKRHTDHQAKLKAALKITAAQEAAWKTFDAATTPNPAAMPAPVAREDWAKLTTPQRMEKMQAFHAERDAVMTKRMDAVKTFYAALTPEQQKVFDAQSFGPFEGRGMHGGRHGERGGHRGMGPMDGADGHMGGKACDGPGAKKG